MIDRKKALKQNREAVQKKTKDAWAKCKNTK